MPYLGRQLTSGNYLKLDDISSQFNGSKTTFNLKSGGNVFTPGSSYSLLVSLGGIIQEAESAYTIDRDTITFASAPPTGHDAFIIILGLALGVGVPADGSVGLEHLQDTAKGVGISSSGTVIGTGITSLNFVGSGNTFAVGGANNGVVDISIAGGGGGAVGTGTDKVFYENDITVVQSYTISSGKNAMSAGPITLGGSVVVTIPNGSVWTVV